MAALHVIYILQWMGTEEGRLNRLRARSCGYKALNTPEMWGREKSNLKRADTAQGKAL